MQLNLEISQIAALVDLALAEDIGPGDVTTEAIIPAGLRARARIVLKEPGVVAGLPVAEYVLKRISKEARFRAKVTEGRYLSRPGVVAEASGPARVLLTAERLMLNFLQRLSGIATLTRRCVEAVKPYPVQIMDTRKTVPGWRYLEKYAVRAGGGVNHRMGLYDAVLIKDNHISLAGGSIREAVARARAEAKKGMWIEVETENLEQVEAALDAGADIIMLDNMSLQQMRKAVALVRRFRRPGMKFPLTEASGGITLDRVRKVAATGVDRISLGEITHSARALDIGMEIV